MLVFTLLVSFATAGFSGGALYTGNLKASNADPGDQYGASVDVSGDTMVVGAPYESSNATGVNGPQEDNGKPQSGAASTGIRCGPTHLEANRPAQLPAAAPRRGELPVHQPQSFQVTAQALEKLKPPPEQVLPGSRYQNW